MIDQDLNVAVWKNTEGLAKNPNAPVVKGTVKDEDGNVIGYISLWKGKGTSDNTPVLSGKISPPMQKQGKAPAKKASAKRKVEAYNDEDDADVAF